MEKKIAILLSIVLLLLTACTDAPSKEDSNIQASGEALTDSVITESTGDNISFNDNEETAQMMKYYEYLNSVPTTTLFMSDNNTKQTIDDQAMAAFAISFVSSNNSEYDFTKGAEKAELDEITNKYFGKTVDNYETQYTTVLESGNITSTGWGPTPYSYVLKEFIGTENGALVGNFYQVGAILDGITYEKYLEKLKK